jgi:Resolvase, N terminal domain
MAGTASCVMAMGHIVRSRPTRDLLNIVAAIAEREAGFRSLKDTWADTTTPHGRLMLTVLGGLAEFERRSIPNTARDDALILPHRANPRRMEFSGMTTIRDPILPAELTWFLAMTGRSPP